MKKFTLIVVMLAVLLVAGGAIFLVTWKIPAPSARVEKVLPDERFPR